MYLRDIRFEIAKYLEVKDLVRFVCVDQLGQSLHNYSFWKLISDDRQVPTYPHLNPIVKDIQLNIQYGEHIHQQVMILINKVKYDNKINLNVYFNKIWISFFYLKHQLNISNVNNLYNNYKYRFNENIAEYDLEYKHFKKLYLSTTSKHQLHYFSLKFKVPKIYNALLSSYEWLGFTFDELYSFLFNFAYYIDIVNPILISQCIPLNKKI